MDAQPQAGFIIWITGMGGAGKTTLARYLHQRLALAGRGAELLDPDEPNDLLTQGLGATKDDRDAAVRRVGHVAKLLARHGVVVICAALSPYREAREALRREARRFLEVFVDCPMETLEKRVPVYRKALAGEVRNVPGVDDPYEPPTHAEITVRSDSEPVAEAAARVLQALVDLKVLAPAEFGRATGGQRPRRARPAAGKKAGARAAVRQQPARHAAPKAAKKVAARRPAKAGKSKRR